MRSYLIATFLPNSACKSKCRRERPRAPKKAAPNPANKYPENVPVKKKWIKNNAASKTPGKAKTPAMLQKHRSGK